MSSELRINEVAVVGFATQERTMLMNFFRLTAARAHKFRPFDPAAGRPADLYLVDSDQVRDLQQVNTAASGNQTPIILVGESNHGSGYPLVRRPIGWGKLLKTLEDAVVKQEHPAEVTHTYSVLVVDDSLMVRRFMQGQLAPFGFNVDFAESGEEAVAQAEKKPYTCVFLDVVMPGMNGYQVCKLIKAKKREGGSAAVVMLTSMGSAFDKIRGSMAGCDAYLTKPVNEDELLEVIAKYLPTEGPSPRVGH